MSIQKNNKKNKIYYMNLALKQAKRYIGNTGTNPSVGCVIVNKNHVISSGHTCKGGRPHAEQIALLKSKKKIKNLDMYVTLEPCSNFGKTPPCTNLIIKKKIKRVFYSLNDPDTRSFNLCSKTLRKNHIISNKGLLGRQIKKFYTSYFKFKRNDTPFVTAKLAVSKDFYTIDKKNRWITNEFSRGRVHTLRSKHDCLITSIKTVINDNPLLNCRIDGLEKFSPYRVILDKNLDIPKTSLIVRTSKKYKTLIIYNKQKVKKIKFLKKNKIKLIKMKLEKSGNFNLKILLYKLKSLGFSRILVESGVGLTSNFLKSKLVDEFQLFISNKNLGKSGENSFRKFKEKFLLNKNVTYSKNIFDDRLFSYKIK